MGSLDGPCRDLEPRGGGYILGEALTLDYLGEIVDTTTSTWKLKPQVAGSLKVSAAALKQIQRAQTIQSAFFAGGGATPEISFELRPVRMDPVTTNFMLNINGQSTNYSHGPLFNQSFMWPGEAGVSEVQIQFSPLSSNGRSGLTLDGPWAFFRLLRLIRHDSICHAGKVPDLVPTG